MTKQDKVRRRTRLVAVLLGLLVGGILSACGSDTLGEGERESHTLNGNVISIADSPRLRVGDGDGWADVLHLVRSPFLMPDGRLVVPVWGDMTVRIYSEQGEFERFYGGEGDGPGELRTIGGAWAKGDTIEVWDFQARRISRFVGDAAPDVVSFRPDFAVEIVLGPVSNGWIGAGLVNPLPQSQWAHFGDTRDELAYHLFSHDGADQGPVARAGGWARYLVSEFRSIPEPLTPQARSQVHGDLLFVGETLEPRLRIIDPLNGSEREVRWEWPQGEHDPETALAKVKEEALARATPERRPQLREDLAAAQAPARLPVFHDFLIDDEGLLWVLPYDPMVHAHVLGGWRGGGPGGQWYVYDLEGQLVAEVELPPNLYPSHITADCIVGVEHDEFGVESVAVYDIARSR